MMNESSVSEEELSVSSIEPLNSGVVKEFLCKFVIFLCFLLLTIASIFYGVEFA